MDFLLIKKDFKDIPDIQECYAKSFDVFRKRGQQTFKKFENDDFHLSVYNGMNTEPFHCEFENGDFVISMGTLIYRNEFGRPALKLLYEDFLSGKRSLYNDLIGGYNVLIFFKNQFYVFNDFLGLKRIYKSTDDKFFSSSFLALSHALSDKTPSDQEIYEYLLRGAMYGNKTVLKELELIPRGTLYCTDRLIENEKLIYEFERLPFYNDFDRMVGFVTDQYLDLFKVIVNKFGSKITTALSGGYDSRLMLGLLMRNGIVPSLYVYGRPEDSDVRIAKYIAKEEGIEITHLDKESLKHELLGNYERTIENNFYIFDGLGNMGIFDDGTDVYTRITRSSGGILQLNGAGGEVWRNFWGLNRFSKKPLNFVRQKWDVFDYSQFTERFSKKRYFENFTSKLLRSIDLPEGTGVISRREMEISYPLFRYRYFQSIGHSTNLLFSDSLMPLMETKFLYPSFDLPIQYKYNGRFEAAVIKNVDEKLASYNSNYGYNFTDEVPLNKRLKDILHRNLPVAIKPYLRYRISKGSEISKPSYLSDRELSKVLDLEKLFIASYVNVKMIKDPISISRAFSLEYFFKNIFSK